MTKCEICRDIIEHGGCYLSEVSCNGADKTLNAGTPCPCCTGKYFKMASLDAAKKYLQDNLEDTDVVENNEILDCADVAKALEFIGKEVEGDNDSNFIPVCGVLVGIDQSSAWPFIIKVGLRYTLRAHIRVTYPTESKYRPYSKDELNDLVGKTVMTKTTGRKKLVTGKPVDSNDVNIDGNPVTAETLLTQYVYVDKSACGVLE